MDFKGMKTYTGNEKTIFEYEKPALLIVDMQKGFLYENDTPFSRPQLQVLIPRIRRLLDYFRENDLPVFFAEFIYTKNCPSLNGRFCPWEKDTSEGGMRACYIDDETSETVDELKPLPTEHVVRKMGFSSFVGTSLDYCLRTLGVRTLVVAGIMADQCVLSTICSAFDLEYEVTMPSDCVMALTKERTDAVCEIVDIGYGNVLTLDEVLQILEMKKQENK